MGAQKLTEVAVGSTPTEDTHFLVTQPETVNNETMEAVRRPTSGSIKDLIAGGLIAPKFSDQSSYAAGSYVLKNGVLYRFTANHTGAWTGTDAEVVTVGGEIGGLKNVLNTDLESKITSVEPLNWFNAEQSTSGILHKDGTIESSTTRFYTDYIPTNAGDIFRAYYVNSMVLLSIVSVCCYNSGKNVMSDAGTDTIATSFTVPAGVSYVRITLGNYYTANPWITKNYAPSTSADYSDYFAPYEYYNEDFLTPETKEKVNSIPSNLKIETVKGTNLVPASQSGTGAYVPQSGKPKYFPSYTSYKYVVCEVKQNTDYFVNFSPNWWILTNDNDNIISSGTTLTPTTKRYINTGSATKLYFTTGVSNFNTGLIISEGTNSNSHNVQKEGILTGINQLMFDTWYACALPKNIIRLTKGIAEKFYFRNILSLPNKNSVVLKVSNMETVENDGVLINPNIGTNFNNYIFTVFDDNLSLIENNVNGQFGESRNDNVQSCSVLLLGDSTIAQGVIGQKLIDEFIAREKTVTLLGTLGTGDNKNEGRAGWSASQYLTNSQYEGVTNPFYNQSTSAFDFSYYMTNQSYNSVDFVVIQLGINDLYNVDLYDAKARINTLVSDIFTIISSIKTFNANQKIILNLPTPCTSDASKIPSVIQSTIMAKFVYYNAMMLVLSTNFSDTRCSNCHLILDASTDIYDTIHPNTSGYSKMALEILSQINCFQNA